ncbi:unnamed protein product [Brugia timori]|uniref:Spo12-like protein n=1 Tax=Brugia timori TaxID=42155 RepID=A0A0R3QC71_9BILA|nr:unnamed protein product [Brugia timori]
MVTSKKKGSLPSKALLDAKKRAAINASLPVSSAPFVDKKPVSHTPARVMMSNTFMDALMDPGHKKPPPKQAKKRSTLNLKPSISVIPSVMVCSFIH